MNRLEKIKAAKEALNGAEINYNNAQAKLSLAKFELARAENSFDIGSRVEVIQLCKRGCCVQNTFKGKVLSLTDNGSYNILCDDGKTATYIWGGDMKLI